MTEPTTVNDDAVAWVQALQARGVTLKAHGKKGLVMVPKRAYSAMSNDERATLKAHKADIVKIVREGRYAPTAPQPETKMPPAPCKFCYRSPCIGEQHPLYFELHPLSERQLFERGKQQLEKDIAEKLMRLRYGLPPLTWDL